MDINKKSGYTRYPLRRRSALHDFILKSCRVITLLRKVTTSYIIPPMPPPAGIGGTSSLMFATTDSVVRSVEATEHAF